MTTIRAAEIGGAALVATSTAAGAVVESGLPGWLSWIVPIGAGIVAGYFAARITTEKALTRLETRHDATDASLEAMRQAMNKQALAVDAAVGGLREEMRWYYQRKGPGE